MKLPVPGCVRSSSWEQQHDAPLVTVKCDSQLNSINIVIVSENFINNNNMPDNKKIVDIE